MPLSLAISTNYNHKRFDYLKISGWMILLYIAAGHVWSMKYENRLCFYDQSDRFNPGIAYTHLFLSLMGYKLVKHGIELPTLPNTHPLLSKDTPFHYRCRYNVDHVDCIKVLGMFPETNATSVGLITLIPLIMLILSNFENMIIFDDSKLIELCLYHLSIGALNFLVTFVTLQACRQYGVDLFVSNIFDSYEKRYQSTNKEPDDEVMCPITRCAINEPARAIFIQGLSRLYERDALFDWVQTSLKRNTRVHDPATRKLLATPYVRLSRSDFETIDAHLEDKRTMQPS